MLWSGGDPRMLTICLAKARLSLVVTLRVWVAPIVLATCSRPSSRSEGGEVRGGEGGRGKRQCMLTGTSLTNQIILLFVAS